MNLFSPGTSTKSQWDGYYEQDGTRYRFRAEFTHDENIFRGKIIDIDAVYSRMVIDDYLDLATLSQTEKIQYKQKIAQALNCTANEMIEVSREQTVKSYVEGDIENDSVSFLKTYESGVIITFSTDKVQTSYETKPYSILYEGILSDDGNQIAGKWFLEEKAAGVLLEGSFSMSRA